MTAQTTPRLGLMLPAASDNFVINDFDQTMTKLDGTPGVTPVANYAALPTGLTSAQHGSCYVQTDNGAMWMWSKPGAAAGSWVRINSTGVLSHTATYPSAIKTSATGPNTAATIATATFTARGGRQVYCLYTNTYISSSNTYGCADLGLWLDGSQTSAQTHMSSGSPGRQVSHTLAYNLGTLQVGTTHTVTVKMWITDGSGTAQCNGIGFMDIWEL